jgi:hypothetical protein
MSQREKELKNQHLTFKIDLNQMKKAAPTIEFLFFYAEFEVHYIWYQRKSYKIGHE